jgi:hypothetical protein
MTPGGLLIRGALVPVPVLTIIPPASHGGPDWARLDRGDGTAARSTWIRQVLIHTTGGQWPQPILPGAGPGGECARYADIWQSDPAHSAAHLVVASDGTVACLADLVAVTAYHAEASNPWSIGIEMAQGRGGELYQDQLDATARLVAAICREVGIPEQMPRGPYRGAPLRRMEIVADGARRQLGGPDVVGVLGHRDNTSARGRGDPGDAIWTALAALGFEGVDYAGGEDLELGRARQRWLNAEANRRGETWSPLVVDGLVGPESIERARQMGIVRWRDVRTD